MYALVLMAFAVASAALAEPLEEIRGRVTSDGESIDALTAELRDASSGLAIDSARVQPNGSFVLRRGPIAERKEEVVVLDPGRRVLGRQPLSSHRGADVEVSIRSLQREEPVEGLVSFEALRREPPAKAARAMLKAQEASDPERAIRLLRKAIAIYPEYWEAHNNLGARFYRAADYQNAREHFDRADALNPRAVNVLSNLSLAHYALRDYFEAEAAARKALGEQPDHDKALYALGLSLLAQGKQLREAAEALTSAGESLPYSRAVAALARETLEHRDFAALPGPRP